MSTNTFTSITNESNEASAAALRALNPKCLIWIQFNQPIHPLKASPAIECVFRSIVSDCEQLHGIRADGLAITYARNDDERFPSDYRFPLFVSWSGPIAGPSISTLQDILERTCIRLRACEDSTVFKTLVCRIARSPDSITNVIDVSDLSGIERQGILVSEASFHSLHSLCVHEAGHTAIARHYGHSSHWRVSPTALVENGDWIQWDGTTCIHSKEISRSHNIRIGLAGVVAECLWENPDLDEYEIDDFVRSGIMELSLSDAADSEGYSIRDLKDTMKLVRRHMPSIVRDADWYMCAYGDYDDMEEVA